MQADLVLRPWAGARAQGRTGFARLLFFMQVSLVLWPAAVRAAYRLEQARQKQQLLNELAEANAAPPQPPRELVLEELPVGRFFH